MQLDPDKAYDLSARIAAAISGAIVSGALPIDARLPSELDLSDQFKVSRSTVREALKRLDAKGFIRTKRGATGGAFVNRLTYAAALERQVATATLFMAMNDISFATACEARFTLERACVPLAVERRTADHLASLRAEAHRQAHPRISVADFCASDLAFHRTLVDAAGNPVMSCQLAGVIEAMQPLMTNIRFSTRVRTRIFLLHGAIADALEARDSAQTDRLLIRLAQYINDVAQKTVNPRRKTSTTLAAMANDT